MSEIIFWILSFLSIALSAKYNSDFYIFIDHVSSLQARCLSSVIYMVWIRWDDKHLLFNSVVNAQPPWVTEQWSIYYSVVVLQQSAAVRLHHSKFISVHFSLGQLNTHSA